MVVNAVSIDAMTRALLGRFPDPTLPISYVFSEEPRPEAAPDFYLIPAEKLISLSEGPAMLPYAHVVAFGPVEELPTAFSLGCADYLKTPWTVREFAFRLERLCGRLPAVHEGEFRLEGLSLSGNGRRTLLTREERAILVVLAKQVPEPVSRSSLYRSYHPDVSRASNSRSVDMHIHELRAKIGLLANTTRYDEVIYTARPIGYGLRQFICC
jgi:DNA-binding response OmpR family regulator